MNANRAEYLPHKGVMIEEFSSILKNVPSGYFIDATYGYGSHFRLNDKYEHLGNAYTNNIFNPWYYEMTESGFNYRLSDIHSSLARSQIKMLDNFIEYRHKLAINYDSYFKDCINIKPTQMKFRDLSSHHLYVIRIKFNKIKKDRNFIMNKLKERGIGSQVHYIPVPLHPFYKKMNYNMKDLSNCNKYYEEALSIPLFYNLDKSSQLHVVENLKLEN